MMPRRRVEDEDLSVSLTVRMTQRMHDQLRRLAEDRDWTIGLVVREALKAGMDTLRNAGRQDD